MIHGNHFAGPNSIVKRYDVGMRIETNPTGFGSSFPLVYPSDNGEYVRYEDYARLKYERDLLDKKEEIQYRMRDDFERLRQLKADMKRLLEGRSK